MFARRNRILGVVLGLSDLAVIALSYQIAYLVRISLPETPTLHQFFLAPSTGLWLLAASLAIWWVSGVVSGVYRRLETHDSWLVLRNTVRQSVIATLAFMGLIYMLKLDISRGLILIFSALTAMLLLVYRLTGRRLQSLLSQDLTGFCHYVIVGTSAEAVDLARMIESGEDLGNRVLAFVRDRPGAELHATAAAVLRRAYPLRDLADLPAMLEEHVVDEVIFAVDKQSLDQMEDIFLSCEEEGVKTRILVNFFAHLHSEVYLERLQSAPLLTFSATPENEYLLFLKRAFDVAFSAGLLIVLSPFYFLVALLVKLTSPGPVIYSQERCGLNGRRFRLYKFRSMFEGAEQRFAEVQHLNELDGPAFKSSRDPRTTPLGRHLRRLSIDEWPQLVNILKGEMSFVGPRPPVPAEVEKYERWQRRRLRMKPGLTCLWALEGRNELDFRRWMRLDLDYIEHWSLALDFKIICRTIPRVLSGRGAS